ncbi:MAG TPA: GNAT family N-acetyltransferase [Pyrinomonadaceae bacterium]|nr:GNAT family N-acetyltransferase [Pyrinomonadaceae bacterium]
MEVHIHIRPADAADAVRLSEIAFAAKAYWKYPAEWLEKWRTQLTIAERDIEDDTVVKLTVGVEIAGFYMLREDAGKLWLEHLWVEPRFIGRGLGRKLFEHAVENAGETTFAAIYIESDPNAEGFYAAMGAERVGESRSELDGTVRELPLMEFKLKGRKKGTHI